MKILQVSKFYPPQLGGIETVARDLSAGLVTRGVPVEVLCANVRRALAEDHDPDGVRVVRAPSWGLWLSTSIAPGMGGLLRTMAHDADIVHVHMPDPMAAAAVWWARPRGKLVLHWHSDVVRQRWAMRLYRPLQSWLLRRADAIVATSRDYAESSLPLRPHRAKVTVVPIGTQAPEPPPAAVLEATRQWLAGRRLVFALGRMTYYKGYEVLIEAARSLPEDVVVVVAGGGPELAAWRERAARVHGAGGGAVPRIVFSGPMSPARVEAHFALASVFCLASTVRAEAYGVVVAEAMARGVPVVTTRIPGSGLNWLHRDGETGLSVPPGDAAALAGALQTLLADPTRARRMGQAGRLRWQGELQAQQMADTTLALYQRLLAGRQPAGEPAESAAAARLDPAVEGRSAPDGVVSAADPLAGAGRRVPP